MKWIPGQARNHVNRWLLYRTKHLVFNLFSQIRQRNTGNDWLTSPFETSFDFKYLGQSLYGNHHNGANLVEQQDIDTLNNHMLNIYGSKSTELLELPNILKTVI